MRNPYKKEQGFAVRFQHACNALENHAKGLPSIVYSRKFDSLFEMFDGKAMIFEIMHVATIENNALLIKGIEDSGYMPCFSKLYQETLNERNSLLSLC